jgi:hypothetical protein
MTFLVGLGGVQIVVGAIYENSLLRETPERCTAGVEANYSQRQAAAIANR